MTKDQHIEALESLLDKATNLAYGALMGLSQLPSKLLHDTHKSCIDELMDDIDKLNEQVEDGYY